MTSLRAAYPLLTRDRFSSWDKFFYGVGTTYNYNEGLVQANGWMFVADYYNVYASRDGVTFVTCVYDTGGEKLVGAAYGGGVYVLLFSEGTILTSAGPDENLNWGWAIQEPAATPPEITFSGYFTALVFDGTAFIAVGLNWGTDGPLIQRALPPATAWTNIDAGAGWYDQGWFLDVAAGGGKVVAVGRSYQDVTGDDQIRYLIQSSDDHGVTWTTRAYPVVPPLNADVDMGLARIIYAKDRFLTLESIEESEAIEFEGQPVFGQSTDGETWEDIMDRLALIFPYEYERELELPGLYYDNGNVLVFTINGLMRMGRMGEDGPDNFEAIPIHLPYEEISKTILFRGNYYFTGDAIYQQETAFLVAYQPRIPPTAADLEWTPHEPPYPPPGPV